MAVTREQAGRYRQLAQRLRIHHTAGHGETVSERPRDEKTKRYLDSDDEPTLISLRTGDQVDVDLLLRTGAIAPYAPPAPPEKDKTRG